MNVSPCAIGMGIFFDIRYISVYIDIVLGGMARHHLFLFDLQIDTKTPPPKLYYDKDW